MKERLSEGGRRGELQTEMKPERGTELVTEKTTFQEGGRSRKGGCRMNRWKKKRGKGQRSSKRRTRHEE